MRWREPIHNSKRVSFVLRSRMLRLLWVIMISSGMLLAVLMQFGQIQLMKALVALALVVAFIVAVSVVHAKVPPFVVVGSDQIYRGLNDETADEWKYEDIVHCAFTTKVVDGTRYHAMAITSKTGDPDLVLVPPTVSLDALRSFLAAKGIAVQDGSTRRDRKHAG